MPIVDVDVDCMSIVVFKCMVDCRLLRVDCCMMLLDSVAIVTSVAVPGGPLHPPAAGRALAAPEEPPGASERQREIDR